MSLENISIRRIGNALLVLISYYVSKLIKRPIIWGYPIAIAIEPTTSCNLRCPECPSGKRSFTRDTGNLNLNLFNKISNEIAPYTGMVTLYFQGEPFLHNNFFELLTITEKHKFYTVTSTNGHYLSEENCKQIINSGLHRIIISVDGIEQRTYEKYRIGGSLEKVLNGLQKLRAVKNKLQSKTPEIVFQFVVFSHNEHELPIVKSKYKQWGADKLEIKSAQVYDFEKGSELIPTNNNYSRYKKTSNGKWKIKNKLLNHCWKMWHSCVITWDGKVVPCCFDKDANFIMGDLKTQSLKEIWHSSNYTNFRKSLLNSRKEISICKNCSEGTEVSLN